MTAYLLDTHVVLWWQAEPERLRRQAHEVIADPANRILFSAACAWEIAIKRGLGRLEAHDGLVECLSERLIEQLAVTEEHSLDVESLPDLHRDPFDRLLAAQARRDRLVLVTRDAVLQRYPVECLPA